LFVLYLLQIQLNSRFEDRSGVPAGVLWFWFWYNSRYVAKKDPEKEQVEKIDFRTSTFCCAYCNRGGEKFSEVFSGGKCNGCGGPAGVVVEISRPEDIEAIRRSVLLIYCEADEDIALRIMKEMTERGVEVIDPQVVVDNEQAGRKANVLSFLVNTARFALVIPSPRLSSDPLVAAAVESGLMSGRNNIAPLYPDPSYQGKGSLFLDTRYGIVWQEGSAMRAMDKSRFVEHLKKELKTN